ncbi:TIGR02302 family protein [Rhodovulum sp. MB263]|uniref:TIGR02302 family protein n=1 Tax=Rhodovulum sp. (strain MB263) TaxID=308754 RepID=UPI0009B7330D|nr:TIGR02302 family protein [Rhodovulum sp. MB263]ARC89266.1 TIGR02302 family protein [Rhodovulum sp. MB263]
MTDSTPRPDDTLAELRWPLRLTWAGLLAERLCRAFWPLASLVLLVVAALAFGAHDLLSQAAAVAIGGALMAALLGALAYGLRGFRRPGRAEALDRLDRSLPGRPISALSDIQAIGAGDPASEAVWRAHVTRMAARARAARAVAPDLRLSSRDPYGLRHVALIAFTVALIFGSFLRVASVADLGRGGPALASGPSWEGWIEPPAYTARPAIYLNDIAETRLAVPQGSRVTLRLYGKVGALGVTETVSGREPGAEGEAAVPAGTDAMAQSFEVIRDGRVGIDGDGGRSWQIVLSPDIRPEVRLTGEMEVTADGEMRQPFSASDDYGVTAGEARITLDPDRVSRRYGLAAEPDPREPLVLDLPMPISGDRRQFTETLVENLSQHPWAGLPVRVELAVEDALGQRGVSAPAEMVLPGRRFFDPLARAIVEQRQALLWARSNAPEVAQILRAISYRPEEIFRSERAYLQLRVAIRRLERAAAALPPEAQTELAGALWDIAVLIEDGDLSDAAERLRRAQERLAEAMRNGASDAEIALLMEELREATRDYMRQLAEQQQDNGQQQAQNGETQEITGDQLQQMLDRLQQLMEEGRMAEAQQLLQMLQQMMENMQVTQGPGGDNPGQQAMEGLAETLRDQQGLSDDAFRDLQEQFNPGQQGQGEGGQGQRGEGQREQDGAGPGQGDRGGQQGLAERQEALRRELERQRQNLPGLGASPQSEGTREALDRAGRAMDKAERSLRDDDLAGALNDQAEAMEALREGMRNLGEALAQNRQRDGTDGQGMGRADAGGERRDPLGRAPGSTGQLGTEDSLLQGEDVYRRARDLLDEIRRRSGEQNRPDLELDYLRRLLERF